MNLSKIFTAFKIWNPSHRIFGSELIWDQFGQGLIFSQMKWLFKNNDKFQIRDLNWKAKIVKTSKGAVLCWWSNTLLLNSVGQFSTWRETLPLSSHFNLWLNLIIEHWKNLFQPSNIYPRLSKTVQKLLLELSWHKFLTGKMRKKHYILLQ